MNEVLAFQIETYCNLVNTGKPVAMFPVQERYVVDIQEIIQNHGINLYIENLTDGWKTVWLYRDEYLLDIIKKMPEKPKTVYDHWVLGKIFGYSDQSIKEFLESNFF